MSKAGTLLVGRHHQPISLRIRTYGRGRIEMIQLEWSNSIKGSD